MRKNKSGILVGVLMLTPIVAGIQNATAVPLDGGTLDPTTIPKYVTPLVIPPVMNDSGVSNDYDIAIRQFKQQILPGGIWNTINGRADAFPATTIWSYGPATDPLPDSTALGGAAGVAPAPNSQFNYPAYTMENESGVTTTVDWMNELTTKAWNLNRNRPGKALPHLFAVDQSLHWANPAADCDTGEVRTNCASENGAPYTGPVPSIVHVHGAHVGGASDGYTEAWWLPNASDIKCVKRKADGTLKKVPRGKFTNANGKVKWEVACEGGLANQLTDHTGALDINTNNTKGIANFEYPNTQPSSTIWYHDHSLGMTRLNVYAGPAGFWLIRDGGGETGLAAGTLPGPAPVRGENLAVTNLPASLGGERNKYREIPIVIQGRSFNDDGSLFYPDNRAFFEGLNVKGTEHGQNGNGGQYGFGAGELQIDMDPATSDIAPMWNPEAFFNTMVVNGVTWPKLEVAPSLYRFRLLNGSNSRFINLALKVTDAAGDPVTVRRTVSIYEDDGRSKEPKKRNVNELRFWQVGTEQSLKPTVTAVRTGFATNGLVRTQKGRFNGEAPQSTPDQALLMGLAERADVIVDFRGLPDGTIITMTNTAPDAPFGGFPDAPADPSTTGQVMRFVVNSAHLGLSPTDELHPAVGDPIVIDGVPLLDKKGRPVIADHQYLSTVLNPATAASNPWDVVVDPGALGNFDVAVSNPVVRELALIEESSHLICVDFVGMDLVQLKDHMPVGDLCQGPGGIHATAFAMGPMAAVLGTGNTPDNVTLWSDPITTNINPNGDGGLENTAETWRLYNFTADAHPIHIHLVKFKVLGRSLIGGGPSGVVTASANGTEAWEDGWKDTVISYPGDTTDLEADFDINGLYVWHCHIVEHEDNEMMVPMCVGRAGIDCPAQLF